MSFPSSRSLCLAVCLAGLALADTNAQKLPTSSQELVAMSLEERVRLLDATRPSPVPAGERARILASLPAEGEVLHLDAASRRKLEALKPILHAAQRESVYEIKVIDVPLAAVAIHGRMVVLISQVTLLLLSAEELQAQVAHETGHEYVWSEREEAFASGDHGRLQDLELVCDIIAATTLRASGREASPLVSGIEKIGRFNASRFGAARNEGNYPSVARRRSVIGATLVVAPGLARQPD
jgi:hypothetical protein